MNTGKTGSFSDNSFIGTTVATGVEHAINTALKYDVYARRDLEAYENRVVSIKTQAPAFEFFILFREGTVEIYSQCEADIDASIEGGAFALFRQLLSSADGFIGRGVVVKGDQEMVAGLKNIASDLDVDWEELLSKYLGDSISHQLGGAARQAFSWVRKTADTLIQDVGEFMQEESRIVPSIYEVREFVDAVDEARRDFDHMEARLAKLKNKLEEKQRT